MQGSSRSKSLAAKMQAGLASLPREQNAWQGVLMGCGWGQEGVWKAKATRVTIADL